MTRTLRPLVFLVALLALLPAPAPAAATRDPMTHFFDQSFASLPDEVAATRAEGKRGILVMFVAEDCPWCAKMKAGVLNRVEVQDYYRRHFRILMMDANGDAPMTDFNGHEMPQKDFAFKLHRVRATPVFMFFGLDGKVLLRYTGATRDAREFLWLGEFVVSGAYARTNFTAYKRDRLAAPQGR